MRIALSDIRFVAVVPIFYCLCLSFGTLGLSSSYLDPEGFFTIDYPEGWMTHVSGSEMQFWVAEHQSLGHEMTHVITHWTLGDPSQALLGEGIAVCLDHNQPPPQARARDLLARGELAPLSNMLGDDWFALEANVAYPESGSFACYLLGRYGAEAFRELYPRVDFSAALREVYGADLVVLEREWLASLSGEDLSGNVSFVGSYLGESFTLVLQRDDDGYSGRIEMDGDRKSVV